MPDVIRHDHSEPFEPGRLALSMRTVLGLELDTAAEFAEEFGDVADELARPTIRTREIEHVMHDFAERGPLRLAAERLVTELPALEEHSDAEHHPDRPRRGPCAVPRLGFDSLIDRLVDAAAPVGAAVDALLDSLEEAVRAATRSEAEAIITTLAEVFEMDAEQTERLGALLWASTGATTSDAATRARLVRRLRALSWMLGPGPIDVQRLLVDALAQQAEGDRPGGVPPGEAPPEAPVEAEEQVLVKVGSLERGGSGPLRDHLPLYCHEREEYKEDLIATTSSYADLTQAVLETDDYPTSDRQEVERGWQPEWDRTGDLPAGHRYIVPEGVDLGVFSFSLLEWDGDLLGLRKKAADALTKNREKIVKKAKDASKLGAGAFAASQGVPVKPEAVDKFVEQLSAQLTEWAIDIALLALETDAPFPTVYVMHTTNRRDEQDMAPLSVVQVVVQDRKEAGAASRRRMHRLDGDRISFDIAERFEINTRVWRGATEPAPRLDWSVVERFAATRHDVLAWRQPAQRYGFGAVVRLQNLYDDDSVYAVMVRADVRLIDRSELPPPT